MAIDRIVKPGLDGVVAAQTHLSSVDGEAGELIIAGFPVEALANRASFEETVYLLWNDRLPNTEQLADFRKALINRRSIPTLALRSWKRRRDKRSRLWTSCAWSPGSRI